MRRRRFIARIVPSAVAAGLIAGTLAAAAPALAAGPSISSAQVQVQFDTTSGLPAQYNLSMAPNGWLRGSDLTGGSTYQLSAVSRDGANNEFSGANSLRLNHIETPSATEVKIFYDTYWRDGTTKTASLAIQYDVSGPNVSLTMQNVTETPGYQLIAVNLPSLLSVRQEDGGSPWILDANGGGRLSPLANANRGTKPQSTYSTDPNAYNSPFYPVDAVGTTGAAGSLELQGYLDETFASVYGSAPNLHYTAGVGAQYRVRGGSTTPNILVNQPQIARLTFAGDYDRDGAVTWLDLAKTMRDQAPAIPSHYYDDKFVYMIEGQHGHDGTVNYTFDQAQRLAARISNLVDGNPQVQQMAGIFQGGHDTVEPNHTQINSALGGLSGFKTAQANAANLYNTNLTTDDNYDDQYKDQWSCNPQVPSACENDADITRDINNNLQTFNAWNGIDTSYISGMKKYVDSGRALARADRTITSLGLHDGSLIDAMTWWAQRNDWDPAHPASAVDNLIGGKYKILDEYAKHGIAVNGELARYPFLGKMAMNVDGPEGGGWVGGFATEVPFMATVLRHTQIYGGKYNGTMPRMALDVDPKVMLLNSNRSAGWITSGTTDQDITDAYYLDHRPWMLLSKLDIDTFTRGADGNSVNETLSDRSGNTASIAINYQSNTFSAVYNGIKIMNNYSVTVPMDSTRIAFYSRTAQTLTYPLPSGVNPAAIGASALYGDHRGDIPVSVDSGTISVTVPAGVPVVVYLNQQAPTTINDNAAAVTYSGAGWQHYPNRGLGDVGDDVHATQTNGDAATVTFTGTGIDLLTEKNSDEGTADIYLDRQLVQSINNNAASRSAQVPVYSVAGLPFGTHTVKVVNTSASYLLIDAFKTYTTIPPVKTVNDSYSGIVYNGSGWRYSPTRALGDLSGDVHATATNGDSASFTFYGTGIDVLSAKNSDQGAAEVVIDGGTAQQISGYAATRAVQQVIYSARGLASGPHTITMTNRSSAYLLLDGITTYN
ncbi:hypothetical protein F0L68_19955 [Solihabitans fulvus]|uniref:Uncharacterized protein n=1 Tax=Solihabitans fulvus TaxID=1892852 RepID=A0A5B2XBP3_9PSEU|nr:hypothetical protein [Solihabitans fulvus]KAA2260673.1 hypothetical protein F0L68_19955 [Solihabitans fulvus]